MRTVFRTPARAEAFEAAPALCWDFRDHLLSLGGANAALMWMAYPEDAGAALLARLETAHAPPSAALVLGCDHDHPVVCGMSRDPYQAMPEAARGLMNDYERAL